MTSARAVVGFLIAAGAFLQAQQYVISTYAGGSPPATPVAGTETPIGYPRGLAIDAAGNVYFSSSYNCVFKLDTNGVLTRIAGNSRSASAGDGGPATGAQLSPGAITIDSGGNLFVVDGLRVRKITPDGTIVTVAGTGLQAFAYPPGTATDNIPAVSAPLSGPAALAADEAGNLYLADVNNNVIRRLSITTF